MNFNTRRWILKEYNTQFIWLCGIVTILLFNYPVLYNYDTDYRNSLFTGIIIFLALCYGTVKYLKKSGRMVESR